MSIQISTRIDKETKEKFDNICKSIGISPSNALNIFIKAVINNNGIPFPVVAAPEKTPKMSKEAVFGCIRGQFQIVDDFDAPMDDF
ncbi:MAG: type II toxin-antitoxin system RelB/DinJ family antitoxin [Treponema sp.]|nr:type II toxin-antitoxin system RelB/DinJ family antitoxin [Treponema sp.]